MSGKITPASRALAPQRQTVILEHLRDKGVVSIAEMAVLFDVSHETIRRDLKVLAEQDALNLVHGGAAGFEGEEPPPLLRSLKGKRSLTLLRPV
ncbi:DeoR family transcriptional regulator [uncultured Nitratireductor sp.]|uniref:DeoR family transcriptional regulator n=1 Tax=uncultured Nitratireductor sp. TaxID=520953 RepID=UPI002600AE2A|nr:DeoR family transcriptional regulator [uncultured Nitratireductor sp.]